MTGSPKTKTVNGKTTHFSVGAVIKKDNTYLIIDRATPPFGFAGVAGHWDEGGETPFDAVKREVHEEVGLTVTHTKLLYEEFVDWDWCSWDITGHYWYLYDCEVQGKLIPSVDETKGADWYTPKQLQTLADTKRLQDVWIHWFTKLGIIQAKSL